MLIHNSMWIIRIQQNSSIKNIFHQPSLIDYMVYIEESKSIILCDCLFSHLSIFIFLFLRILHMCILHLHHFHLSLSPFQLLSTSLLQLGLMNFSSIIIIVMHTFCTTVNPTDARRMTMNSNRDQIA